MFKFYNNKKRLNQIAYELYGSIVAQTRKPFFYANWHVPDSVEGRFEVLVIHMSLFIYRLKNETAEGQQLGRLVSEAFIDDLDDSFREMGVGDLAVPKRVKMASEAYFGRLQAYSVGLDDNSDCQLAQTIIRNITGDEGLGVINAEAIGDYMMRSSRILAALDLGAIRHGKLRFAERS